MFRDALARLTRRRGLSATSLAAVTLGISMVLSACGGGGPGGSGPASIAERNAAAREATSYESGEAIVEALAQAGVPCAEHSIGANQAQGVHVLDSVTCKYSADDWVAFRSAAPSVLGRQYYSAYFNAARDAQASVSTGVVWLEGDHWYANAPVHQRLYTTQDALGGQLLEL